MKEKKSYWKEFSDSFLKCSHLGKCSIFCNGELVKKEKTIELHMQTTLTCYKWVMESQTMEILETGIWKEDELEQNEATLTLLESGLVEKENSFSNAFFVGEGPQILVENIDDEKLEEGIWEVHHYLYDLSKGQDTIIGKMRIPFM